MKILKLLFIPPLIGLLGAIITEYVLGIGVLGGQNLNDLLVAGGIAGLLAIFINSRLYGAGITAGIKYAVAVFLGVVLIPYFAFLVGQIDFYMVDDNLAEGFKVIEVRPTMEKIAFGTPDKGEVAVWQGPSTLKLHPGENRVKLGRFNMEKGTYEGGNVYIGNIEVDIVADLSIVKNPQDGKNIPEEKYAEIFEIIKGRMSGQFGPFSITLKNSQLNGNIGSYTLNTGGMTQPIPIPKIEYPGMGGPDITLDITLDEMGKPDPSKIKAIVDMPPGVAEQFKQYSGMGNMPSMGGVEFR